MLRVDGLELRRGDFHLGPLTLELTESSLTLLKGSNGSGKTSFLKTIIGRIRPTAGSVQVTKPLAAIGIEPILIGSWTLRQNADFFSILSHRPKFAISPDLLKWEHRKVDFLSAGLKRRAEIDLMISLDFQTYLFDEPLNALDQQSRHRFAEQVFDLRSHGKTILIATHDDGGLFDKADKTVNFS